MQAEIIRNHSRNRFLNMSVKIKEITSFLEEYAPLSLQEAYDNAGLITGSGSWNCTGILIALDSTEEIINEAISKKCNLVIAHHPIVFKGLKKITGNNYVERTIIQAIKNDIAIYAIHTNLDNVLDGVNRRIADKLGLSNVTILQRKSSLLKKLVTYVPTDKAEVVRQALFDAGAGQIGKYSECSFNVEGTGTFKGGESATPYIGEPGKRHNERESRVELIFPGHRQSAVISALLNAHPYEEVAYDIFTMDNEHLGVGSGLIGELEVPLDEVGFLQVLKESFGLPMIRHTALTGRKVARIAVCGGAGIFLLQAAKAAKADAFITADVKYHEFFDAEGSVVLADIGHYESEQFTIDLLFDILSQKFRNFAVLKTALNTNPVRYS